MAKYRIEITDFAKSHLEKHYKSGNKANLKKLEKILFELEENPFVGVENPEQLKHKYSGYWSRRINQKDRLIYTVEENIVTVYIISALGNYSDK